MQSWRDRFNSMGGKTRFVVCRLFLHLAGSAVAPLIGLLNQSAQRAVDSNGDLQVLGEGLVDISQALLQHDTYWQSAANEGDIFWDESEAGDYINELFTDSAQRYQGELAFTESSDTTDTLTLPITQNLVVILTVAYEGAVPELEIDLSTMSTLKAGLKSMINLHYQNQLRAIQIHFAPAQLGDELTSDQLLMNFPELLPL
ncbi:MAG: DUF1517 domain-containing protein [Oculatellaceae cyanobacterium bins.114]|nr:DUF1517 domain-containing protein [Oculatellaceae cyanobacterium bins.114]